MHVFIFCAALTGAVILLAVDGTPARAQKAKQQLAAVDMARSEVRRSVFSGNEMQVGQFWTVKPDCSSGPLVDIRIVKAPSHGDVSLQESRSVVELKKEHARAHCNGKSVDALGMFYISKGDFTGTDKMQIEVDYKVGLVRRISIIVNVR
jgi:hypothetical protein